MAGAETREACGNENASPLGGDIAQKIREMDRLACYGASPQPAGEGQLDISKFRELWSTLRDDILMTLVQGVQAAVVKPPQYP